jgi:hypothetical protein
MSSMKWARIAWYRRCPALAGAALAGAAKYSAPSRT